MNPTIETLLGHRSIRRFQNTPVGQDELDLILQAATQASTWGNMQAYSIIVTRDRKMKQKLLEPHLRQSMIVDAPIFLTFCADFHRMRQWLKLSDAPLNFDNYISFMIAGIDAVLASQTAAIAAESLGLGICYMGTTLVSAHHIGEIFGCPENVVPIVGFAMGYPNEKPGRKDRLPMRAIVHDEVYREFSDSEIQSIYRNKNDEGLQRNQKEPESAKQIEILNIKNLAQVYTIMKYTRASHIEYSREFLRYLEAKNFF